MSGVREESGSRDDGKESGGRSGTSRDTAQPRGGGGTSRVVLPPNRGDQRDIQLSGAEEEDERSTRFGDSSDCQDLSKSKTVNDLRAYYAGSFVDDRMTAIRTSIVHIRQNWSDYSSFMTSLRKLMQEHDMSLKDPAISELADSVFSAQKVWGDKGMDMKDEIFDLIRLYTSLEGYRAIFRVINGIFRQDEAVDLEEKIRSAVFLVELLNIELFNYCLKNPIFNNFQGIVYRGLALPSQDLSSFDKLRHQPIPNRYIAIPLGLMSATTDLNIARKFITKQMEDQKNRSLSLEPLVMKIHVIEVKPEYLAHYRKTFPTSVVSTICAVDIGELSFFPSEKEVLLRGPFFQVLHLYESGEICGRPCRILEMVMLNTNRDHINSFLGDQDGAARTLFGTMVGASRCQFAVKYCKDRGLDDDAEEYRQMLKEKEAKLLELMG